MKLYGIALGLTIWGFGTMNNKTCCACGEPGAHDIKVDKRGTEMPLCPICERIWEAKREQVLNSLKERRTA